MEKLRSMGFQGVEGLRDRGAGGGSDHGVEGLLHTPGISESTSGMLHTSIFCPRQALQEGPLKSEGLVKVWGLGRKFRALGLCGRRGARLPRLAFVGGACPSMFRVSCSVAVG